MYWDAYTVLLDLIAQADMMVLRELRAMHLKSRGTSLGTTVFSKIRMFLHFHLSSLSHEDYWDSLFNMAPIFLECGGLEQERSRAAPFCREFIENHLRGQDSFLSHSDALPSSMHSLEGKSVDVSYSQVYV